MKELVKQDINFCEYPVWFQDPKQQTTGLVWTDRKGYTYRVGYKTPTKTDIIFLYYLMFKSQQAGWKEKLILSQREILRGCGIAPGKRWADRLKDSLERWKMVGIKFTGTFYDGKDYQTMNFGVIDEWDLEKNTGHLNIRFAPKWLERIKSSNYFRYIDFQQMKSLGSPLTIRLYEILIKSFQGRSEWNIDALKLAAKIPMKEKYVSHIASKITTAVDSINAKTNLNFTMEVKRPKRGQAIFIFRKLTPDKSKKTQQAQTQTIKTTNDQTDGYKALIVLLPDQHQGKKTVREVISKNLRERGVKYTKRNILYTNDQVKQPGRYRTYLVKALLNDWAKGWEEDQDQEATHKKQQESDRQLAISQVREEKRLRELVTEKIQSMSKEELKRIETNTYHELTESEKNLDNTILRTYIRAKVRLFVAQSIA